MPRALGQHAAQFGGAGEVVELLRREKVATQALQKAKDDHAIEVQRLQAKITNAEANLKTETNRADIQQRRREVSDNKVLTLRQRVGRRDATIRSLRRQVSTLTSTSSSKERELARQLEEAEEKLNTAGKEKSSLENEQASLNERIKNLDRDLKLTRSAKETAENNLQTAQEENEIDMTSKATELTLLNTELEKRETEVTNLRNALRMAMLEVDIQVTTLPEETAVIRTFREAVIKPANMTQLDLYSGGDVEPDETSYDETLATEFVVPLIPKNVVTLMGYCLDVHRPIHGSIDDLSHILLDYLLHPKASEEPLWVWLTLCHVLCEQLDQAMKDRDGLRVCMALSLGSKLNRMMRQHRKVAFLGAVVADEWHDDILLEVGLGGFTMFVLTVRYRQHFGGLAGFGVSEFQDKPGIRYEDRTMQNWTALVKQDGTLLEALLAEDLRDLRNGLGVTLIRKTEETTGCTLTIIWEQDETSWMKDTMLAFLEMNNTDKDVVFNPPLWLEVTEDEGKFEARLLFRRGSRGILVLNRSSLDHWLQRFLSKKYHATWSRAYNLDEVVDLDLVPVKEEDETDVERVPSSVAVEVVSN